MPFVSCPPNATVRLQKQYTSRYVAYDREKPVGSGSQLTSAGGLTQTATKLVNKGKMVKILEGLWSPARDYTRTAATYIYTPGMTLIRETRPRYTRVWEGYPEPSSIWAPSDNTPIPKFNGCTVGGYLVGSLTGNMKNRLNTELLVKAGKRQVNFGEALGESKTTLLMLAKSASSLANAFLMFRKGRWKAGMRYLGLRGKPKGKTAAEKWLSVQYGWLPLMSDIYDTSKLLKNGFAKSGQLISVVRNISEDAHIAPPYGKFTGGHFRASAKYTAKMWYRLSDSWLNQANQMGLVNPLEVAWALVPFSFVVDWLLPVGNYLEALTSRCGITFVDGYYGVRIEANHVKDTLKGVIGAYTIEKSSCRVDHQAFSYKRSRMTSLPFPGLYVKNPFSTLHLANAIALLRQLR